MIPAQEPTEHAPASELLGIPQNDLRLRVHVPKQQPRVLQVRAAKCTVGSAPECTLRISGPQIQPVQCLLLRGARGNFVRWVTTENNLGHVFRDAVLRHGDRLRIGSIKLEVLGRPTTRRSTSTTPSAEGEAVTPAATMSGVEAIETRMQRLEKQFGQLQTQSLQLECDNLKETIESLNGQLNSEREGHLRDRELLISERQRLSAELDSQTQKLADLQNRILQSQSHAEQCQQDEERQVEALHAEIEQLAQLGQEASRQHEDDREQWLAEKSRLEAEMSANRERLSDLESQLEDSRRQHSESTSQCMHFESQVKDLNDALGRLAEQLDSEQGEFKCQRDEWLERREQLEVKLAAAETNLAEAKTEQAQNEQLAAQEQDRVAEKQARWEQECQELAQLLAEIEETRLRQETAAQLLNERCATFQTRVHELEQQVENLEQAAEVAAQAASPNPLLDEDLDVRRRQLEPQQEQIDTTEQGGSSQEDSREIDERRRINEQLEQLQHQQQITAVSGSANQNEEDEDEPGPGEWPRTEQVEPVSTVLPWGEPLIDDSRSADVETTRFKTRPFEAVRPTEEPNDEPAENFATTPDSVTFQESLADPPVSTAEVLARLGQTSPWQDDDDEDQPSGQPAGYSTDHRQPPQADAGMPQSHSIGSAAPSGSGEMDESIEDYMNRLMARVRGNDSPESDASPEIADRQPITEAAVSWQPDPQDGQSSVEHAVVPKKIPVSKNYLPRSQAPEQSGNLSAMRELANQSARTAIATHAQSNWSAAAKTKRLLLAGGLGTALVSLMFLTNFPLMGSLGLALGLGITIYFGWQTTALRKQILGSLILHPPEDKSRG